MLGTVRPCRVANTICKKKAFLSFVETEMAQWVESLPGVRLRPSYNKLVAIIIFIIKTIGIILLFWKWSTNNDSNIDYIIAAVARTWIIKVEPW